MQTPQDETASSSTPAANEAPASSAKSVPPPRKSERPSMRPGGAASLVGTTLSGRYLIERVIGEGGMGAVYACEHLHMRKRLAVKILHPDMSRLPEVVARFEREAVAAAHIDHPNVAAATDFGKLDDGSFFLVLEYIEGKSLREVLGFGRMEPFRAMHIAEQIAAALGRAHALGIVHRDLKPENVMLIERESDPDFVKVLDFGIAKVPMSELARTSAAPDPTQAALTQLGMVYGTPEYMAPEQALGQAVDPRADLYALGVMAYEMLTGFRPFDHESKVTLLGMHVAAPVPPMSEKAPGANIPPEIEAIVKRLLAKEASARFPDARAFLEETSLVLRGTLPPSTLSRPSAVDATAAPPVSRAETRLVAAPQLAARARDLSQWLRLGGRDLARVTAAGIREIPSKVWMAAGASLGALAFVILFVAVLVGGSIGRTGATPAATVTTKPTATATAPKAAKDVKPRVDEDVSVAEKLLQGGDAVGAVQVLAPLETKYPERADIHRILERAYSSEQKTRPMLQEAQLWLAYDGGAATDRALAEDLRNAALGKEKEDVDAAFALLEGPMGPVGADILYDIAFVVKSQSPVVTRARQALQAQEVRGHASEALLVSLDLRAASTCEGKRALLPRAKDTGDARTLAVLSSYTPTQGCGFLGVRDCWPCLHKGGALAAAINAISSRLSGTP